MFTENHLGRAQSRNSQSLPDVARDAVADIPGMLDKVGMTGIEVAVRLRDVFGRSMLLPASVDAFVSLDDPDVKGIHMSRLYVAVQNGLTNEDFSFGLVCRLLKAFLNSQSATSRTSYIRLSFDFLAERRSLLSDHAGWRKYPVNVIGKLVDGEIKLGLNVRITYSSTCPCSAALARQLIQHKFHQQFAGSDPTFAEVFQWLGTEEAVCATPHSQRSYADVELELRSPEEAPTLLGVIDTLEEAVGTSVQATVKREDEQEFARLNGSNLMFAEDAARRFKNALHSLAGISDFRVQVNHLESLHPHDAVAVATKGITGGLRP